MQEVIGLQFYDKHMQLISLSLDKTICLWDANKLDCIQSFKDFGFSQPYYTASAFAPHLNRMFVCCRSAKVFKLRIN